MDKDQKKQLLKQWRDQQRSEARARLPLPCAELQQMFEMLNVE
jgi:hypothetical protein